MKEIHNVEIEQVCGGLIPKGGRTPPGLPNPEPSPVPTFPQFPPPQVPPPRGPIVWGE